METFARVPGRAFFAVPVGRNGIHRWYQRMVDESGNKTMRAIGLEDSQMVDFSNDQSISFVLNYWQALNLFQDMMNAGRFKGMVARLSSLSVFGEVASLNGHSLETKCEGFDHSRITQRVRDILCSGEPIFGLLGSSY